MSETSARASRFAFWFGSFARNGLIGFRSAGAGVVAATTGIAGDVTAIDATDGGVGGGRSPGGMMMDGADANAPGAAGAAPGIRAGAMAPSADGDPAWPPATAAGWAGLGIPAGAIDGIPGAMDGAGRGGPAGAVAGPLAAAGAAGRLDPKLGANPGANAGRGA